MDKPANRNMLWARLFVDELQRAGLKSAVISPGSRSTPLALEFGRRADLDLYVHPDERGAAFFALGLGLAGNQPAALLCTSGTAAANYYPAVVEAHQANVPLLVLTADRPYELRDSGSNQTIDQVKMYGSYTRWSAEVAPPEAEPPRIVLRYLRSLATRALAAANGLPPGPVHLNLPFRKPLEPIAVRDDVSDRLWEAELAMDSTSAASEPFVHVTRGQLAPSPAQIERLAGMIQKSQRGLIYCGPRCPGGDFPQAAAELAALTGYPILADALSGVRFSPFVNQEGEDVLGGYETFLRSAAAKELGEPDLLLQFGAVPTSAALGDYLSGLRSTRRVHIDGNGAWSDDSYTTREFVWADPAETCCKLASHLKKAHDHIVNGNWNKTWARAERLTWQEIEQVEQAGFFEGAAAAYILDSLKTGDTLFAASSLPVRHLDQFGRPRQAAIKCYANRGASGIDGTIASAAGTAAYHAAETSGGRTVLLIGDLAFYHDLNSLLLLQNYQPNLTIVLINNHGGGIFRLLPISSYEPLFTPLFLTPQNIHFAEAATAFGLPYQAVDNDSDFIAALQAAISTPGPKIIEVAGDAGVNESARREILDRFNRAWASHS